MRLNATELIVSMALNYFYLFRNFRGVLTNDAVSIDSIYAELVQLNLTGKIGSY